MRLIECDHFPFEFLSQLAERESWRKEVHRPIYHVHKWWAKRLGSVFRGILLGCTCRPEDLLEQEFYREHSISKCAVFDPFMGSGTTIGEAHKLGLSALGRDINPVAVEAVATALGPVDRNELLATFHELSQDVGERIRSLYRSVEASGSPCEVLYYFWVMQSACSHCAQTVDLFPSYIIARNAYPDRKPEVQILCPRCGEIFAGLNGPCVAECPACKHNFDPNVGPARGGKADCPHCTRTFTILDALGRTGSRPRFRFYGKLVLVAGERKRYLRATVQDEIEYEECSRTLQRSVDEGQIQLPDLRLENGHNTRQAMRYGFASWRDFFNDRQLLALSWLRNAIEQVDLATTRAALRTLFSGVLEFNNLFASYKGEGTGAVRHMFSHHILKPERTPIEANVWGTPKSSGSFSNLFRSRLLRAVDYRKTPVEVNGKSGTSRVCSAAFSGRIDRWPAGGGFSPKGIYLSCGDSGDSELPSKSIDLVVTDPPFFDNVHYSELADFFYAWQQLSTGTPHASTRNALEVQDSDAHCFAEKLQRVLRECHRVLKDDGLLAFTYHHSRHEGWESLANAILGAGFVVINSQPLKAEMSVATPKSQATDPIQLDIVIVCRKQTGISDVELPSVATALASARSKLNRLRHAGFTLSRNDRKIVLYGQLLTTVSDPSETSLFGDLVDAELQHASEFQPPKKTPQLLLFEEG